MTNGIARFLAILSVSLTFGWSPLTEKTAGATSGPRWAMGAIGDSISAATFADVPADSKDPEDIQRFFDWMQSGFDREFLSRNRDTLSWTTGSQIRSQHRLLQESLEASGTAGTVEAINVAVPGAKAADAVEQARALVKRFRSGQYDGLLYVTFLIGANDACNKAAPGGTPNDKMRASIWSALEELAQLATPEAPVRVLLSSIPPIPDLGAPKIRSHPTILGFKCKNLRDGILKTCASLLRWNDESEHAAKMRVVQEKNAVLAEIALAAPDRFPGLQIAFSDRLSRMTIDANDLAADCFHPDRFAQEQYAAELWRDQPWY